MAPPRRSHTKSRNGCLQCKRRRVKCDEIGPPCTNCATRGTRCEYIAPPAQLASRLAPNTSSQSPSSVSSQTEAMEIVSDAPEPVKNSMLPKPDTTTCRPPLSTAARFKELELMHRWCMSSCRGFVAEYADLFQGYVVQEGLKHEFLMESILAISALHIASEMSDAKSAEPYINTALHYQTRAVPALRMALLQISPSNCDAIFAASILTMVCTIVSPLIPSTDSSKTSPTESLSLLYDFIKGIVTIVDISRPWLSQGPLKDMLDEKKASGTAVTELEAPAKRLKDLNDSVTIENRSVHQVYDNAIRRLNECFTNEHVVFPWLVMVGEEFMRELRKREPMALLIFMHWGVSLDQVNDIWWAKYSGKKLVEELSGSVLGNGAGWDEATNWAKARVGL
ncbi:C6 transcription factor [Phlyctema vagabunda]|uniref:C6 transcription factor n=1 Tax=Phlyctema vagabunda TaxID=108571 RepID=A0ABR4P210_9HELO